MDEDNRTLDAAAEEILAFWLGVDSSADAPVIAAVAKRWFHSTPEQDAAIAARFGPLTADAAAGRLDAWAATPRGRLALIVLLDQFPRNLYRGTPAAFAQDAKALAETLAGLEAGDDRGLDAFERVFFCMPLQHAESRDIQRRSVEVFEALARAPYAEPVRSRLLSFAEYARLHRDIIERFGRFPHRNAVLERQSTHEERAFLDDGGPTFGQ